MNYRIVNTHNKNITFDYNDRQITKTVIIKPKKDFILVINKLPISLVKLQTLKHVDIQILNIKQVKPNVTKQINDVEKVKKVVYPNVKKQTKKTEPTINKNTTSTNKTSTNKTSKTFKKTTNKDDEVNNN